MAVNLNKHRDALLTAWKDVLNEKTATNWVLFGYEGQTNDLKLVSKGDGGLEELSEDLNSGKIMYAFAKIQDTKTSLNKCVLINWQGEGANTVRKGLCANHLRDIENFFTGAHLTINARNEDEVEPELIIAQVAKAGSAYSFKTTKIDNTGPAVPVGSNYKRVNPVKEINPMERDQFWMKEEQEEKKRLEEERKRKESERLKRDEEVKQREVLESAQREAKSAERNSQIAQIKEAERLAQVPEKKQDLYVEEPQKVNQSDLLRQQRKQEAQELISQRTIDARSVFEKNTSAGQIKKVPEKPVRNSLLKAQAQTQQVEKVAHAPIIPITTEEPEVEKVIEEPQSDEETEQYSTIKRSPRDAEKKAEFALSTNGKNEQTRNNTIKEQVQHITEQQFVDEVIYQDFAEGPGLQARALYDYQAADDTEITFDPGQIITNIDQVDEGWWQGLGPDGTYGLFPANYVELINQTQ